MVDEISNEPVTEFAMGVPPMRCYWASPTLFVLERYQLVTPYTVNLTHEI